MKNDDGKPKEQQALAPVSVLDRITTLKYSDSHDENWRNDVAKDLNELLGRAQWTLETMGDEECDVDIDFANAVLRVCERVEKFEDIMRSNESSSPTAAGGERGKQ